MAVVTQNSNKVWQKVKSALNVSGIKRSGSGVTQEGFLALKLYLATQKSNPDLQFIAVSAGNIITAPEVEISGAGKLYAAYFKRVADNDATDSFVTVYDDATDDAGFATDTIVQFRFNGSTTATEGEEAFAVYPEGHAFATGLVVASNTDADGTTGSAATESADGFLIVGSA
jgi:hypothetical protein